MLSCGAGGARRSNSRNFSDFSSSHDFFLGGVLQEAKYRETVHKSHLATKETWNK
jgi:hypothetical protein